MTQIDDCRAALDAVTAEVARERPADRARALLALLQVADALRDEANPAPAALPGWNLALRLCLEHPDAAGDDGPADRATLAVWAARFLAECDQLALAYLGLERCAMGEWRLQQRAPGDMVAWPASRRLSAAQRERADFDWWSAHVEREVATRLAKLVTERPVTRTHLGRSDDAAGAGSERVASGPEVERHYRRLGDAHVARFACQHSYPADATIGGATFGQYAAILGQLIGWLLGERDAGAGAPVARDERALIDALARALGSDVASVGRALQPFILDRDNAAYHSALPGRAAPPLIRLDAERLAWSARGMLGEPLVFLARELRRRHAQEYHNSAHLREGVFRQDLYRLFGDKRFALSAGTVELRRDGAARTDLDAVVFDRKTGTLGVFELKAQDPFARSAEERLRQRDNFLHANRQVSAILEWSRRRGPDDILSRFDERVAKRFHVQKVYVFVLGRYVARFTGGAEPDRRAAWGSWPQVLQLVDSGQLQPDQRNPLGALFARLRAAPLPDAPDHADSQTIAIRDVRLRLFPSFAAARSASDDPASADGV